MGMGILIDMQQEREDRGPWCTGWGQCTVCLTTFVATVPEGYQGQGLDCPKGHTQAALWPIPKPLPLASVLDLKLT